MDLSLFVQMGFAGIAVGAAMVCAKETNWKLNILKMALVSLVTCCLCCYSLCSNINTSDEKGIYCLCISLILLIWIPYPCMVCLRLDCDPFASSWPSTSQCKLLIMSVLFNLCPIWWLWWNCPNIHYLNLG